MALGYNASDKQDSGRSELKAGIYPFKVETAEETTFASSGNKGLKVKVLVGYDGRDIGCFANLAYTDKALWRVEQFLDSIGCDFASPPDAWELVAKTGMAEFVVNERGYFEVKNWLDPVAQTKEINRKNPPKQTTLAAASDDVPF